MRGTRYRVRQARRRRPVHAASQLAAWGSVWITAWPGTAPRRAAPCGSRVLYQCLQLTAANTSVAADTVVSWRGVACPAPIILHNAKSSLLHAAVGLYLAPASLNCDSQSYFASIWTWRTQPEVASAVADGADRQRGEYGLACLVTEA